MGTLNMQNIGQKEVLKAEMSKSELSKMKQVSRNVEEIVSHFVDAFVSTKGAEADLSGLYDLVMTSLESQLIGQVLERCGGNKVRASQVLGIHRNTLAQKVEKIYGASPLNKKATQRVRKGRQTPLRLKSKARSA